MRINDLTARILNASFRIHSAFGPGLLESVYLKILAHELAKEGLKVATEVPVPVVWDGVNIELGFRADMIVENQVIVELKAVEEIAPVCERQLLTYLRVTGLHVGLLINFGEKTLKEGIRRIVNQYEE